MTDALGNDEISIDGVRCIRGDRILITTKPRWWQWRKRRAARRKDNGVWMVS